MPFLHIDVCEVLVITSTWSLRVGFVASRFSHAYLKNLIKNGIRTRRIKKHLNKNTDGNRVVCFARLAIFFSKKRKRKVFPIFYFARQDRYDGVSEWCTTAFAYREIVRMRIVRHQRGWYRGDEIQCRLHGPVRVDVH